MKQHIDKITDQVFQGIQEWRDGQGTKTTEQASELSKLSDKELKDRVQSYVEKLPEASLEPLANGEAIKGNKVSTLTTDIQRVIASPDQAKALENFTGLNATKYDAKANFKEQFSQKTVLGNDIISLMMSNKKELNYHDKFTPAILGSSLSERPVTEDDLGRKDVIVGLAAGMLAKIAGHDSEFSKANKAAVVLPDAVIKAAYDTAIELAKNSPYNNMNSKQAMEAGKKIGKEVRTELFKERNNHDVQALTEIMTNGRVVKGKSVDDLSAPVAVSEKKAVDMGGLDSLAEKLEKQQSPAIDSSSSSKPSDDSNRSSMGSFALKVRQEEAAARSTGGKGSSIV